MNCKDAKSMLLPFLKDELSAGEADGLCRHLKECGQCREDLEIYYIVERGIEGLNEDSYSTYNFKEDFENLLNARQRQARNHLSLLRAARILSRTAILVAAFAGFSLLYYWFF